MNGLCDGPAERPLRPAGDAAASGRRGWLAGPGGVPGRTRRLPPGRAAARLRGRQAGVHRRARADAGAAGAGTARHREKLLRPPSPCSPGSKRRWRRSDRTGSSCRARPTPPPTCCLKNVLEVQEKLRRLRDADPKLFAKHFDARLLDVPLYRVAPNDPPPAGVVHLVKDAEKEKSEDYNADIIQEQPWAVVAVTPGGTYGMLKQKWSKCVFGHELCDLLVLDEASQMNLPEAVMAALPMKEDAPLIVVGDHRQMPPIVKHDWDRETRRTFRQYQVYESLFDTLRCAEPAHDPVRRELPAACGDGRVLAAGGLPARRDRLPLEEDGLAGGASRRG